MSGDKLANMVAVTLLGACFAAATVRVFTRRAMETDPNRVTIRFAHWQLEGGVRDAFGAIATEYEKSHPGVAIEQMTIPEKIARNWARTQLVGGTAPDLVEVGGIMGTTEEDLGRYFTPLTSFVEEVNPYNQGTPLEHTPWRETFVDGLNSRFAWSELLLENYAIPSAVSTIRLFYNRQLLRDITGSDQPPASYQEFIALCVKTESYRTPSGEGVIPIAGSKYNAPFFVGNLFASQTQRLRQDLNRNASLEPLPRDIALGYLDGNWSWRTPAVQSALRLVREVGLHMQRGFLSVGRDDATFYFAQGRALMIATGSWDATSIRQQAPFEVGIIRIPAPAITHPEYGKYVMGEPTENGIESQLAFALNNKSAHQTEALDFLRFLTSQTSNQKFSDVSGWVPAVIGVVPGPLTAPFQPVEKGVVTGFVPNFYPRAELERELDTNLYRLVSPSGSVEDFTAAMEERARRAIRSDLDLDAKNVSRTAAAKDATLSAFLMLQQRSKTPSKLEDRTSQLFEAQNQQETGLYYQRYKLKHLGNVP